MEEIVRIAVAEPPLTSTLAGLTVTVRPGELDADSVMVPVNPLTAIIATVDVAVAPARIVMVEGLEVIVKSVTKKTTVTA